MSVQITTGSLIALGVGAGDVASIVGLSKRVGNWMSAASGDNEFLAMLDEDEFNVLRRRGLMDLQDFNKRWRKQLRLLANGEPMTFNEKDANKVLENLGRFTAVMICVVTALETFTTSSIAKAILKAVLKELLRTTERGEDLLSSQYTIRFNAWRSVACLRGLTTRAGAIRRALLERDCILDGLMPAGESRHVEDFLLWLLAGTTDTLTTSSSDIAGIAVCLSQLGMDVLTVEGLGLEVCESACRLIYSKDAIVASNTHYRQDYSTISDRGLSVTVSLLHPEESVTQFPTSLSTHNRSRHAWKAGMRAAEHVILGVVIATKPDLAGKVYLENRTSELKYTFLDRGTDPQRTSGEMQELASAHAFVVNQELLVSLENCFGREPREALTWLNSQTSGESLRGDDINDPRFDDIDKVDLFCVFQSFFIGYYYGVFMRMVDTSSLQVQVVEGSWGYRSTELLNYVRRNFLEQKWTESSSKVTNGAIPRKKVVELLSRLFLNESLQIAAFQQDSDHLGHWCLGIVAKRTLLTNSLVNKCLHPGDTGRFVLLDVDTGGVPRDTSGVIRSGYPEDFAEMGIIDTFQEGVIIYQLAESSPPDDVTFHIEADWEGDPDKLLLCVRYRGRRINTISPAVADKDFCSAYVQPIKEPKLKPLSAGVPYTISSLTDPDGSRMLKISNGTNIPLLVQAYGKPCLRYAFATWYSPHGKPRLSTNCIHAALQSAVEIQKNYRTKQPLIVIAGQGKGIKTTLAETSTTEFTVYATDR